MSDIREYAAQARSTDVPGRVLASARNHHMIADGPVWNGFPGEAITPGEMFLGAVASCGVELIQLLASRADVPLRTVAVDARGYVDPARPVREDVTVFNRVEIGIVLAGVSHEQGEDLVKSFKGR